MLVPEEVSLEGYQRPLVHDELYGLWFPRLRTTAATGKFMDPIEELFGDTKNLLQKK